MYLIDTNIFLELLLDRKKSGDCESFLKKVEAGEIKAVISSFALHSIELIMLSYNKIKELKVFLISLLQYKGLSIYYTDIIEELKVLEIMKQTKLDFDDALQYFVAKTSKAKIVSLDTHFDGLKVERIDPKDV